MKNERRRVARRNGLSVKSGPDGELGKEGMALEMVAPFQGPVKVGDDA